MPKIPYIARNFSPSSLATIAQAEAICEDYAAQGFTLTLRQLYYQFVSRDLIANSDREYKRLGSIINDARLAGLIDWRHLEDRTRNLRSLSHWSDPAEIVKSAAYSYRIDKWERQRYYVEVWIEKDALVGVIEGACDELDVPYFSCRGYASQSEVWGAAQRLIRKTKGDPYGDRYNPKHSVIFHLGDHDPSGIDMSRDIADRLRLFCTWHNCPAPQVRRLALNFDQIDFYSPPPNPAKLTDSRAKTYLLEHGDQSWELDALEPAVIAALIREAVNSRIDVDLWNEDIKREEHERGRLQEVADRWDDVADYMAESS